NIHSRKASSVRVFSTTIPAISTPSLISRFVRRSSRNEYQRGTLANITIRIPLSCCYCLASSGGHADGLLILSRRGRLAVNELPHPDFEIDQRPEPVSMVGAGHVFRDDSLNEVLIEQLPITGATPEDIFVNHPSELSAQPGADRDRKSHFA